MATKPYEEVIGPMRAEDEARMNQGAWVAYCSKSEVYAFADELSALRWANDQPWKTEVKYVPHGTNIMDHFAE